MISLKLLVSWKSKKKKKRIERLSEIKWKGWGVFSGFFFLGQVIVKHDVYQPFSLLCLSVSWQVISFQSYELLSWNAPPHPSIHHHYNSPMVNNHKSNEIHKPLRWCLLSLILGSSDIHGLEVRAFRPIICSIYAIFPSFYHMNYALCHNLPEHFSSQESYSSLNSFSLLAVRATVHHLSPVQSHLTGRS